MRHLLFACALTLLSLCGAAGAAEHECPTAITPRPLPIPVTSEQLALARRSAPEGKQLGTFSIVIVPGPTLQANAAALAAFQRAAAQWAAFIGDPITVTINADLADLGDPQIIGSTNAVELGASLAEIRTQLLADAAADADDGIVASVPASPSFIYPNPYDFDGDISIDKATAKAMGFTGLDGMFGTSDALITFNSTFPFDFDDSDGVGFALVDFETVAAHEIGHALGFDSAVDFVDVAPPQALPVTPLDLFRFPDGTANDPASASDFATMARSQTPGSADVFDDLGAEDLMSTGQMTGDGRQASHWKDDGLTGMRIGMMDPTLADGETFTITTADLRALDVIGWDISLSGPTTTTLASCDTTVCDDTDVCTDDTCDSGVGCVFSPVTLAEAIAVIVDPVLAPECVDSRPGTVTRLSRGASRALGKAEVASKARKRFKLLRKADNLLFKASLKLRSGVTRGRVTQPCSDALAPGLDRASDVVDCVQASS